MHKNNLFYICILKSVFKSNSNGRRHTQNSNLGLSDLESECVFLLLLGPPWAVVLCQLLWRLWNGRKHTSLYRHFGVFFLIRVGEAIKTFSRKVDLPSLGEAVGWICHWCAEAEPPEKSVAIICVSTEVSRCGSCLLAMICMSRSAWTQLCPQTSGVW